ncbi:hypothetical protein [Streptomyces beigongshangae]|uniref:hypothetical protein n=1 Tax=Streptomyces beigongshangae TaxID=2841597 RepID=UPI001C8501ED|nr:hypothetical protein [Streptomyces sp. REN17]
MSALDYGAVTSPDITRRIGVSPRQRGSLDGNTCPDIFELNDGSFAIIGADRTDVLEGKLPADAGRSSDERIVVITRETLIRAKLDIPDV